MKPQEGEGIGHDDDKASGGLGEKRKHAIAFTLPGRRAGQTRDNDKGTFGPRISFINMLLNSDKPRAGKPQVDLIVRYHDLS